MPKSQLYHNLGKIWASAQGGKRMQEIRIKNKGILEVVVDGKSIFNGTPKELTLIEGGVAIKEFIITLGVVRDKLIEAEAQTKNP